jgi:hypothetical protein
MRTTRLRQFVFRGLLVAILTYSGVLSLSVHAQQGDKATYSSGGVSPSQVWIDASAFWTGSPAQPDICLIIDGIIQAGYPNASGAVIDARGLYNSVSTSSAAILCSVNPFQHATSSLPPTTVLLPEATIPVTHTWTIPNNTRIVGEGQNTNLIAASPLSAGSYMIEMGYSTSPLQLCPTGGFCTSVGVEHLLLSDSNGLNVGGIQNQWSQGSSYVDHVNFHSFNYYGLQVAGPSGSYPGGTNSGPYSNIAYGSANGSGSVCIDIETQTLGVHGVTCTGNSTTGAAGGVGSTTDTAGIYINGSNNSVEDVHIESFYDGIEIGNNGGTVGNITISNVESSKSGGTSCNGGTQCLVKNTVHICGSATPTRGACANSGTVTDVTLLQITGFTYTVGDVMATVQDDASGTSIVRLSSGGELPLTTAIYALGEPDAGGYTRFATNPANPTANYDSSSTIVPTWGVNDGSISSGSSCLTPGALYTNTGGSSGSIMYVCTYGTSGFVWKPIA